MKTQKNIKTCLLPKKILLIEDDQLLRELLFQKLTDKSFTVFNADCGEKALNIIEKEQIDLIILDLMLPNMPGEKFLKIIKKDKVFKNVPVIIMTAKSDKANINNCVNVLKADKYIIKHQTTLSEITSSVKNILHIK